jgi:fibronectin-binding autotransporter adhesin
MKTNTKWLFASAAQAASRCLKLNGRNAVVVAALLALPVFSQGITIVSNVKGFLGADKTKVCTTHGGATEVSFDATGVSKLVVVIGTESGFNNQSATVTGVKFNNVALTEAVQENSRLNLSYDGGTCAIFYLDNPYQGAATFTVSTSMSSGTANGGLVSVIGLSGTGAGVGSTGKSWTTQTAAGNVATSITTANFNSMVIAGVENSGVNNGVSTAPTVVSPLTLMHNGAWGSAWAGLASGYQSVSACGTMLTPTFNTAAGGNIHVVAAEFMPLVPTQYWDVNSTSTGAGGPAATGTWDGSLAKWNPDAVGTNTVAVWSAGSKAVFAAGTDATGTYSVTVDGTNDIVGLIFEEGAVTLANGTAGMLRLTGNTPANTAAGRTATVAVPISDDGAGRQLVKVGSGTLVLSGDSSFGGAMSVAQGTAVLSGDNSAATGGMTLSAGLTRFDSLASINGTTRNVTLTAPGVMMFGATFGAANISNALDRMVTTSTGVIAAENYDAAAFDFNTAGLTAAYLGATGSVTYTGTLIPNSGNYRLGGGGGTLTLTVPNTVSGSGSTLAIGGNLSLTVANDHTGGTTLNAGTLILGDAGALGSGTFTLASAGPLQTSGTIVTLNAVAANSDFTVSGTGSLTLGALTLNANRSITLNTTAGTTTFGATSGSNRTLTFSGNGNAAITGIIATGTGALTKNGNGTLSLSSAASTYTGATTVNGGTLSVSKLANGGANSSIGKSSNADTSLVLGNGTTLKYVGAGDTTDRRFKINGAADGHGATLEASGSGPVLFTSTTSPTYGTAAQTRTLNLIGSNASTNTLAANLTNNTTSALSVVKDGTGTWVLSGTCFYTGATTVKAGALLGMAGGSCASSAVTVTNTPGNLSALGVSVSDNTKQWTCASLAFTTSGSGAELQFQFAVEPSTMQAPLNIVGNLTFNGAPVVVVDPANLKTGRNYPLLVVGGTVPSVVPELSLPGLKSNLSWGGSGNKTLYLNLPPGGTRLLLY